MKHKKNDNLKPEKTLVKKWFSSGISNSLFVWIYIDHINWCLHEDAPYKDTVETVIDQSIDDYKVKGEPHFILEMQAEIDLAEIYQTINEAI